MNYQFEYTVCKKVMHKFLWNKLLQQWNTINIVQPIVL